MQEQNKLSKAINKIASKNNSDRAKCGDVISKELIIDLLIEGIANLERGIRILDRNLIVTKEPLDILAVNLVGELMIIELEVEENDTIILRALEHFDWMLNNMNSVVHKYSKEKIDATLAPRIILISKNFRDNFLRKLAYVTTTEINLYEYQLNCEDGINKLKLSPHEFLIPGNKAIEINKPRLEDLLGYIKNISVRQLCKNIIEEIKFIGGAITVDTALGYIEIKKNNTSLISIYPQPDFFWVSFDSKGKWRPIKVENQDQLSQILPLVKRKIA